MKKILIVLLIGLIGFPSALAGLNYAGVCLSGGYRLSEQQRIQIAASFVAKRGPNLTYIPEGYDPYLYAKLVRVTYPNKEAFLKEFPDCCRSIGANHPKGSGPRSFETRVFGARADVVEVRYTARFKSFDGKVFEIPNHVEYPVIQNCGGVTHPRFY